MAPKGLKPVLHRRCARHLLLAAVASLAVACSTVTAGNGGQGSTFSPLNGLVAFYRGPLNHLSAVRHGECPMVPSCSEYAREAMERHGELVGWMMATDRLMRCGRDETRHSPRVKIHGEWRYYDPVDRNDFWWHDAATLSRRDEPRPK
ncbi:membrane protein insertion efficiency factor YidD [Desulfococcus sp.]|uniref:membrane protein insertion efficiency factor YidD n=1 Tax=Desulfococcus sp. TaxID=2025834 RepID=UPI003593EE45